MADDLDLKPEHIPVAPPEDDEAQPLLDELIPRLTDEQEAELWQRVMADHEAAVEDRTEWERRLVEWEDAYHNRVPDKTFPWPGASNFHVPLTMMGVETYKPRLVEAVLGQTPPVILVASKGSDEERKDLTESFLNWQVSTRVPLDTLVPQSAHLYLQPGLVVAKTYWKATRVTRRLIREFPRESSFKDILESLVGAELPEDFQSTGELEWEGTIPASPQGGDPLQVRLKARMLEDTIQVLLERDEVDEGPGVDLVEPVDLFVPAKGGDDLQALPWCQLRLWMYEADLRQRVALGRFYADAVDELLTAVPTPQGDQPTTDSTAYHAAQDAAEGIEGEGASSAREDQFEILEDYRRWDVNDDGIEEEIIVWVCPKLADKLLGWDYLDNVYAHGRRPIRVGRFLPIPFRFYGISFAEMIKGLQDEINTIHNQKVDFGTITNLPFYFYRQSMVSPAITQPLKPGQGVPVDNPRQDIMFPEWRSNVAFGQNEELILHQYFERLSGLTDLSLGKQPNRVGATRTARGTQTLLSEAGLRFKMALQGFQRFWAGIFEDILALDQEYLPPQMEFRVSGRRPSVLRVKDRTELRGHYDLRLATTPDQLNREQMRQDATVLMQVLLNPAALQAGLVGMKGLRRVFEDLLRSFGKDPTLYLEDLQAVRTPEEELMFFATGQYVGPVMGEDIQRHLQTHQMQVQDPVVPSQARSLLARHLQETMQLAQMQEVTQTLQRRPAAAAGGQQAVNAETGRQPQPLQVGQRGGGTDGTQAQTPSG